MIGERRQATGGAPGTAASFGRESGGARTGGAPGVAELRSGRHRGSRAARQAAGRRTENGERRRTIKQWEFTAQLSTMDLCTLHAGQNTA